jgi:hypothetical protein
VTVNRSVPTDFHVPKATIPGLDYKIGLRPAGLTASDRALFLGRRPAEAELARAVRQLWLTEGRQKLERYGRTT